ncbi:CPXCG motif-containing cysteine-rich protein [Agarilytica rhodophyticola]|uniref:CPXCG motif-containing cysteine-rich protein n=1 Tax=Agarilytica rhodophyticola TaxID=1737490 RepID=UPI000B34174F|nr:CPXCG motif-containing cysteine-rich protein [Agarilytica rhodophyticola]
MNLIEATLQCPYCWEMLNILVEPGVDEQSYVEDCQVCCSPILIHARVDDETLLQLSAERENS